MAKQYHRVDLRQACRSLGLFALIVMMLVQFIAASASAGVAQSHDHHIQVSEAKADCPMQATPAHEACDDVAHHSGKNSSGIADGDAQDATAHCKLSMCCFQGAFYMSGLVAVASLVTAPLLAHRSITAASRQASTRDRPPRLL